MKWLLLVLFFFVTTASSKGLADSTCSGALVNTTGSFRSPEVKPGLYPINAKCKWNITVPRDGNVTIEFLRFHTEACCDYVKITNEKGDLIGQYNGRKTMFTVTVTSHKAKRVDITFKSDSSVGHEGFQASYVINGGIKPVPKPSPPIPPQVHVVGGGDSLMTAFLRMTNALTRIMSAVKLESPKMKNTKHITTFKSELYQGFKLIETLKSVKSHALTKHENEQLNLALKTLNQMAKSTILSLEPRLSPAVCNLPKVIGPCRAMFPRYYYDSALQKCRYFGYGGCQGNANNFEKKDHCEKLCLPKSMCPKGQHVVNCFADPCQVTPCPAYVITSKCESNYCNGCNAFYYDQHDIRIPLYRCSCKPKEHAVECAVDPCQRAVCKSHPSAMCRTRRCNACVAEFVAHNGTIINNC